MVKVISVFIVHTFLISNVSWAFTITNFEPLRNPDCLSPALKIINPILQGDMMAVAAQSDDGVISNGSMGSLLASYITKLEVLDSKFNADQDAKSLFNDIRELNRAINYLKTNDKTSVDNKQVIEDFMIRRSDLAKKVSGFLVKDLTANKAILDKILAQSIDDMGDYVSAAVKSGKITQEQGDEKFNAAIKYLAEWLNPDNGIPLYIIQGTYRAMLEGRSGDLLYSYGFGWRQFGTAGIRNPVEQSEFPVLLKKELNEFAEDSHAPVLTGPNNINAVTLLQQVAAIRWLQEYLNAEIKAGKSLESVAEKLGYEVAFLKNIQNNTVTITYDSRLNGEYFAHMQTAYFLEAGISVNLFDSPSGVPAGASIAHGPEMFGELIKDPRFAPFANIVASSFGILISASHSEAEYNGFKLFIGHQKSQLDGASKKMVVDARSKVSCKDFRIDLDTGSIEDLNKIFKKHKDRLTWLGGKEKLPADRRDYCGAKFVSFYPLYFEYLKQRSPIPYDKLNADAVAKINKAKEIISMLYTAFYGGGALTAANLPGFFAEMGYKNVSIVEKQTAQMDGRFPGHIMPDPGVVEGWMSNMLHYFQQISGEELDSIGKAIIAFNKHQMGGATDPDVDRAGIMLSLTKEQIGNVKGTFIEWMGKNFDGVSETRKKEILKILEESLDDKLLLTANESWTMLAYYKLQILEEFGLLDKNVLYTIKKSHVTTEGLESVARYYRDKGYHIYVVDTYVGFTELAKKGRDTFAIAKTSWKLKQAIDAKADVSALLAQLKQENTALKTNVPYQKQGMAIVDETIALIEQGKLKEACEKLNIIAHTKNLLSCEESNGYGELGEYDPELDMVVNAHIAEKDGGLALYEFLEMLAYGDAILHKSGYQMFTDMLSKIGYAATDNQFLKYPGLTGIQEKTDSIESIEKMLAALIQKAMDEGKEVTMFGGKYKVKEVTIYRDKKYDVTYNGFTEEGIRLILETKRGSLAMTTFRPSGTGDSNRDYNWILAPAPAKGANIDQYRLETLEELEGLRNDFFGVFNQLKGYADLPKDKFYGMLTALKEAGRDSHYEIFSKMLDQKIQFTNAEQKMFDNAKSYAFDTRTQDFENMEESERAEALAKVQAARNENLRSWENYLATGEAQTYPNKFNIYVNGQKYLEIPNAYVKPWMAALSGFVANKMILAEILGAEITTDDPEITNEINFQLKQLGYDGLTAKVREPVLINTSTLQNKGLQRRPISREFIKNNKELMDKIKGFVVTKDGKYFYAKIKTKGQLINAFTELQLEDKEIELILEIWQFTRDFRQTPAMQSDVNKKMKAIQQTMREEDEDIKTPEGKKRLMENWRGWVYGEQEWANEGITDTVILAEQIRNDKKEAFVQVGVGGSDQTTRAIVNGTISSQHNVLTKQARGGAPQIYYTGEQFDCNVTFDILDSLWQQGILFKTIFDITSKSGTTAEPVHTFLIIRSYLEARLEELREDYDAGRIDEAKLSKLGLTPADLQKSILRYTVENDAGIKEQTEEEYFHTGRFFVFTTGQNEKSALFSYAKMIKEQVGDEVYGMLAVPEGTGGRYSFATAVGMLAMGVTANENKGETAGNRIREVLRAVKDVRQELLKGEVEADEVIPFAIARANYLAEKKFGLNILAIYPFANLMLEFSNLIMQISTESIQEKGQGQNILPLVGPSRNHSVVNGIINGPRDKIVSFIKVDNFDPEKDGLIKGGRIFGGDLTALEGIRQSAVQHASLEGTLEDMIENGVPAYKITIPELTPYYLAKLITYIQHEVAIEGQLRGLRSEADEHGVYVDLTYLQKAVEGYKNKTRTYLAIMKAEVLLTIGDLGVENHKRSVSDLVKSKMNGMHFLHSSI